MDATNLESLYVGDPMLDTIGRKGRSVLCTFGSPYSLGGLLQDGLSRSNLLLLIRCSFKRDLRIFFTLIFFCTPSWVSLELLVHCKTAVWREVWWNACSTIAGKSQMARPGQRRRLPSWCSTGKWVWWQICPWVHDTIWTQQLPGSTKDHHLDSIHWRVQRWHLSDLQKVQHLQAGLSPPSENC